jgi:hypothetical protein
MSERHELNAYDYVDHPYEEVRDALLANRALVLRHAMDAAVHRAEVFVAGPAKAAPLEVGASVRVDLLGIEAGEAPDGRPATKLELAWRALHNPAWFPAMRATLSLHALTEGETQLDFLGAYEPPPASPAAGAGTVDAHALHRIARESVAGFIRDVALHLHQMLSRDAA